MKSRKKTLELYNNLRNIFKTQYDKLTKSQKKKIKAKNIPVNLAIVLTLNKLLTRLPIILAQTKAENNSAKLKNKIRQILYLE